MSDDQNDQNGLAKYDRYYIGEGPVVSPNTAGDYTMLIPTDGPSDGNVLARSIFQSALRRMGAPVDDVTLDRMIAADQGNITEWTHHYRTNLGGTALKGQPMDGTFDGYSIRASTEWQREVLQARMEALGPPLTEFDESLGKKMGETLELMAKLAKSHGDEGTASALESMSKALQAGDKDAVQSAMLSVSSATNGEQAILQGLKYMTSQEAGGTPESLNLLKEMARPSEIGKLDYIETLERMNKVFGIAGSSASLISSLYEIKKGVDEDGKPLTSSQYAGAALNAGTSLVELTGATADLAKNFVAREGAAYAGLETVATVGATVGSASAIIGVEVYAMNEVIKGIGKFQGEASANGIMKRFGYQGNYDGFVQHLEQDQARIDSMPVTGNNVYTSGKRIAQSFGDGVENDWRNYLSKTIDPPDLTERVFSASSQRELREKVSPEEMLRFTEAARKSRPGFVAAEAVDVDEQVRTSGPRNQQVKELASPDLTSPSPESVKKNERETKTVNNLLNDYPGMSGNFRLIRDRTEELCHERKLPLTSEQMDSLSLDAARNFKQQGGNHATHVLMSNDNKTLFVLNGMTESRLRTQVTIVDALIKSPEDFKADLLKNATQNETQGMSTQPEQAHGRNR